MDLVRAGRTTAEIASVWPKAEEFGFADEEAAFALQFGHGIGLAIWEKPVISRMVSLEHSHEIKPGMVFALETFWPSKDGWSAARIEEEIVVTATGHEVITRFPAEKLMVAGAHYFTGECPLLTTRWKHAGSSTSGYGCGCGEGDGRGASCCRGAGAGATIDCGWRGGADFAEGATVGKGTWRGHCADSGHGA